MKSLTALFLIVPYLLFSQIYRDTVYIKIDSKQENMIKNRGFNFGITEKIEDSASYSYSIKIPSDNLFDGDYYYRFSHVISKRSNLIDSLNVYSNPVKKRINICMLKDKKVIDIDFFLKNKQSIVEETLVYFNERNPTEFTFLWIYDEAEIENNEVVLKDVGYWREAYE